MTMRLTDRSIWTAPPPSPVRQASAQPVYLNAGLGTYYYWVVSHYPIGSVVSHWFAAYKAPDVISAANPVFLSWEASPPATSYDVLRTEEPQLPTDGTTPLAVATGVTQTTYTDQGAALSPYSLAGLMNGSPVDGWALMNNRDYSKPVLELFPTVQLSSILFSDGSELATATGGGSAAVGSINGLQGIITLAAGPNMSVTSAGQTITFRPTASGTTGQLQFNSGGTPPGIGASPNLFWDNANARLGVNQPNPQVALDVVGPWTSGIEGPARITGSASTCYLTLNTVAASGYAAVMFMSGGVYGGEIGYNQSDHTIQFWDRAGQPTPAMVIKTDGKVGVGMEDPAYELDVDGDVNIRDPGGANGYGFLINGAPVGSQIPATGTAPVAPTNGQLWYDTSVLRLKIWLGAWVQIA